MPQMPSRFEHFELGGIFGCLTCLLKTHYRRRFRLLARFRQDNARPHTDRRNVFFFFLRVSIEQPPLTAATNLDRQTNSLT